MKLIIALLALAGLMPAAHPTGIGRDPWWLNALLAVGVAGSVPGKWFKVGLGILLLALVGVTSMPAAPLMFDCPFLCDSPGASNQSVCAPVAGHISVQVDQSLGVAHVGYDAWNGTLLESIAFHFVGGLEYAQSINVHSNGGTAVVWIPGPPVDIESITIIARGIGGPDRTTSFTASACCEPVPEPTTHALFMLGVVLIGVGRARRRWWL